MSQQPFRDLEWLRKRAKQLLQGAIDADPAALRRLRALPRLAPLEDRALAAAVRLADAQHTIALEEGHTHWAALRAAVEASTPPATQVERLLAAVRDSSPAACLRVVRTSPALASSDGFAAAAMADPVALATALEQDAALARAERGGAGWTALMHLAASPLARRRPEGAAECARLLLTAGADVRTTIAFGDADPPVRLQALYFASEAGVAPLVRVLLEHGAPPDDGESVFHAAEHDRREVLELLLAHGADLSSAHAAYGNTPLFFIAGHRLGEAGHDAALRGMHWLLEHGADPNVACVPSGSRPLHQAVHTARSAPMVEALLQHGADPDAADAAGRTAIELAVALGSPELEALLLAHGADAARITPMHRFLGACMRGEPSGMRSFLEQHPGLMQQLPREARGLAAMAANEGRAVAVTTLLDMGWDIAWEGPWGGTPLHHAAWRGDVALVRTLLARRPPLDLRDAQFGSSPIAWGAHGSKHCRTADADYLEVVAALLDAGSAREPSFNRWGQPPEALASRRVAALLRARGFAPE